MTRGCLLGLGSSGGISAAMEGHLILDGVSTIFLCCSILLWLVSLLSTKRVVLC
jgi:hypothetical protein